MVLIVDDLPENVFSLKSILELHGFSVDTATGGEEALKKVLKNQYSLIILDVQMPGMDGFEVAEFLAGNNATREIPIIFLSAVNTEKRFITKGYASGAIDYIVKPIDTEILLAKVKTFDRLYEQNRALLRATRELGGILAAIPQVAFTATAAGEIDFVNDHWYAYAPSINTFPETHPDDPPISTIWKKVIAGNVPVEKELRLLQPATGEYRYQLLRIVPVNEDHTALKWVGTFTDINEQKQVAQKKDEFLSIASHELKTPLTSIKAYVQLLHSTLDSSNPSKNFSDRALVQVNKLDGLINDLLDVSKIENGKLSFDLQPLDFETLLQSTIEMLQQIYPGHTIKRTGKTSARVMGNALRLEQVLINFISNAVKYAPGNSAIEVITRYSDAGELFVGVKDNGIGISKENLEKIFGKFYRVSEDASHASGLGIGLYICSEILKRHGAAPGVESEPQKGSLFYFTIPVIKD